MANLLAIHEFENSPASRRTRSTYAIEDVSGRTDWACRHCPSLDREQLAAILASVSALRPTATRKRQPTRERKCGGRRPKQTARQYTGACMFWRGIQGESNSRTNPVISPVPRARLPAAEATADIKRKLRSANLLGKCRGCRREMPLCRGCCWDCHDGRGLVIGAMTNGGPNDESRNGGCRRRRQIGWPGNRPGGPNRRSMVRSTRAKASPHQRRSGRPGDGPAAHPENQSPRSGRSGPSISRQ